MVQLETRDKMVDPIGHECQQNQFSAIKAIVWIEAANMYYLVAKSAFGVWWLIINPLVNLPTKPPVVFLSERAKGGSA